MVWSVVHNYRPFRHQALEVEADDLSSFALQVRRPMEMEDTVEGKFEKLQSTMEGVEEVEQLHYYGREPK